MNIVSWMQDGQRFVIRRPDAFVTHILPEIGPFESLECFLKQVEQTCYRLLLINLVTDERHALHETRARRCRTHASVLPEGSQVASYFSGSR